MATPVHEAPPYATEPPAPLQPYTEFNLWSSNPGDEATWPKSAKIYNQMSAKFGPQNVLAPPDWVNTDKGREQWLKRDQNAMLYFMYKKNDYKDKIEKIANKSIFDCFHSDAKAGDADRYHPCEVCCIECCTCGSLWSCTLPTTAKFLQGSAEKASKVNACCLPALTGAPKLRSKLLKRLTKSGFAVPEEEEGCMACLLWCFCEPCMSAHTHSLVSYIHQKRYGVVMFETQSDQSWDLERKWREKQTEPKKQWSKYYNQCKKNKSHPYSRIVVSQKTYVTTTDADGNQKTVKVKNKSVNRRERTPKMGEPFTKLLVEYTKPTKAVRDHNERWQGIHFVGPLQME